MSCPGVRISVAIAEPSRPSTSGDSTARSSGTPAGSPSTGTRTIARRVVVIAIGSAYARTLVAEHLAAFNAHDSARLLAGLAEDVRWATGQDVFHGRDELAELFDDGLWAMRPGSNSAVSSWATTSPRPS